MQDQHGKKDAPGRRLNLCKSPVIRKGHAKNKRMKGELRRAGFWHTGVQAKESLKEPDFSQTAMPPIELVSLGSKGEE